MTDEDRRAMERLAHGLELTGQVHDPAILRRLLEENANLQTELAAVTHDLAEESDAKREVLRLRELVKTQTEVIRWGEARAFFFGLMGLVQHNGPTGRWYWAAWLPGKAEETVSGTTSSEERARLICELVLRSLALQMLMSKPEL